LSSEQPVAHGSPHNAKVAIQMHDLEESLRKMEEMWKNT
jgi:hypothetical protein